jgi:hypothetical protein
MPLPPTDSSIVPPSKAIGDLAPPELVERLETVLALPPGEPTDQAPLAAKYSRETLLAFGALGVALVSVDFAVSGGLQGDSSAVPIG